MIKHFSSWGSRVTRILLRFQTLLLFQLILVNLPSEVIMAETVQVSVGDEICVSGYVMDYFCIDRGTLLDRGSVVTLSADGPVLHSIHCLVDISSCRNSYYEILAPLNDGSGNFGRAWRIEDNTDIISHAQEMRGTISKGYRATFNATVINLGSNSTPALIQVTNVQDFGNGCGGVEFEIPNMIVDNGKGGGGSSGLFQLSYATLVIIHGVLMVIGWGLLLPLGAIFARFSKHWENNIWFTIHSRVQPFALVLVIIGFWIALQNFTALETRGSPGGLTYPHAVCGIITMVLGMFQAVNGLLRPHISSDDTTEKTSTRKLWEIVHKLAGYSALLLAVPTIILGTRLLVDGDKFLITYIVFLGLLAFLIVMLILDKKRPKYSE